MQRWTFFDPVLSETVTFDHNPNGMDSVVFKKVTATLAAGMGRARGSRKQDEPFPWTFKGWFRTKDEVDLFLSWRDRDYPIQVTDHLNRTFTVWLLEFEVNEALRNVQTDWRGDYTFHTMFIRPGT